MNRREKYDAASFILGGHIRNRTKTNSKLYIHTLPIGMYGMAIIIKTQHCASGLQYGSPI